MDVEHVAAALFAISIVATKYCGSACNASHRNAPDTMPELKENRECHGFSGLLKTDDHCQSLFYSDDIMSDGKGFPAPNTVDTMEVERMKTIHPEYVRLSKELYRDIVANIPTVCVDIVLQRKVDGKVLLFYRRDSPAKGLWWLPGGRMLKGESFFDTALRKVRDEMGHGSKLDGHVKAVAVTNVWNTFFHDSSWDADREKGKEGCQTVNISVFCELTAEESVLHEVKAGEGSRWAVEAYRWVDVDELLSPGHYDKYVRLNAECARGKGLV